MHRTGALHEPFGYIFFGMGIDGTVQLELTLFQNFSPMNYVVGIESLDMCWHIICIPVSVHIPNLQQRNMLWMFF